MNTAQEQVTADANALAAAAAAMETAAIDLDAANQILKEDLTREEYAKVHASLAKTSGVLTTGAPAASAAQASATTWVNDNPPVTPPPPPPPVNVVVPSAPVDVVATAGNGEVGLTWGAPTNNGGAAVTSYNVYAGSAVVVVSTSSTSATVSNLTNGTKYTFEVAAVNSAGIGAMSAGVSATPFSPTPPPPPPTPTASVPMVAEFSSYVLAEGGDFEFAEMPTTAPGVIPTGWVQSPSSQISGPSVADDVQIVNGQGLVLTVSDTDSGAGGSIETNPSLLNGGFTVSGPFYRELEATLPALDGNSTVNQIGLWMLYKPGTSSNGGEIDLVITGWGNMSGDMETGNDSQVGLHGPSYLVNGKPPTGTHKFGVSYANDQTGCQFYLDGAAFGNKVSWGNAPPATGVEWFLVLTNQGAAPAGINDATGPTVLGEAGQVIVSYDRTFVPA